MGAVAADRKMMELSEVVWRAALLDMRRFATVSFMAVAEMSSRRVCYIVCMTHDRMEYKQLGDTCRHSWISIPEHVFQDKHSWP